MSAAGAAETHPVGQPYEWETVLQASASPVRDSVEHFHDHILLPVIAAIVAFVFGLLLIIIFRFNAKANPVPSKTTHNTMLEIIWTLVPIIILATIAVPSMKLLYYADATYDKHPGLTVKVTGYQWYWGYEYPKLGDVSFMSNYIHDEDLKPGDLRLLSTDNPLVVPVDTDVRVQVTAADVIHSWSVPAFGVKMDAVPGRINETWFRADKTGTFYGQCSQLCGAGHAYMPIEVKAVSKEDFAKFIKAQGGKMPAEQASAAAPGSAQAAEMKPAAKAAEAKKADMKAETTKAAEEAGSKKAGE
ncbi:MAG: cytochrome c oxidase subunit II [Alphaproteobacteria bacterium]|nr:cytochrome c oxidase subunit II [Alphaproteobacteria bacterium]